MWEMRFLHQAVPDVNYAVILSADFFHSFSCGLFIYFLLFFFIEEEEMEKKRLPVTEQLTECIGFISRLLLEISQITKRIKL